MSTIADFAKKINKEYKDNNLMIMSNIKPNYERMSTGALGLDYPWLAVCLWVDLLNFLDYSIQVRQLQLVQ